ncbi:alpha/beta hydrolase [Enterococcus ureilyticus]|uniref:Alpha/beta hydrolase n=1 Tax=Enterococcus ureilyticus TaxID=1131292 RepID=A0A1E5HBG8_9ENTE|nr:alpha/beta hydrolase [Enterococcus ureilyticus]MBM7689158.1 acetyl esterase/lipase [Enterococcus ureilyticus]OEG22302.1 alpha/beta hydrolase [Enterococcus ureilyticus]
MAREYDIKLVEAIRNKQYTETRRDVTVMVKPIPDCAIDGAMDPRVYKGAKKMSLLMKFIPKSMLKMDASPKSIKRLRKMFNSVDSTPMVEEDIKEMTFTIKAEDGFDIPMTRFQSEKPMAHSPVLYFIHGGGFFAGSTDVVREALRLFVSQTNMIAVSIDYRLAPENPFPIGHKDCYTGLRWLADHVEEWGADKRSIFVAGDSAGGNLTAYCSNRNIEENRDDVCGQILLYPTLNMGGIKDEYTEFDIDHDVAIYAKQASVIRPGIEIFSEMTTSLSDILGTKDTLNKYLTPYMSVSEKMPTTMISSGEHDFLTFESLAYAKKLVDLGVDTTFTLYKGMGHAYIDHVGNYPQAEDCMQDISEFIKKNRR